MKITIAIAATPFLLDKADLRWVKRDPKGFADSLHDKDLVALLTTCKNEYHNNGTSQLTDDQYEIVKDELESRKPNHPLLKKVGATPAATSGRKKVRLPYPMFSLDKAQPENDNLERWLATHPGPYVVSDKEDGLSDETIYDDGIPTAAYTRGDGIVGQDITHLIPYTGVPLSIPYRKRFVVRKEIAMTEADFNKHFSKEKSTTNGKKYENARNLVAGVVNTLNKRHEAIDHLKHYAYEIIEPRMKPSDALATLKQYGFNTVPYVKRKTLTAEWLTAYLLKRKAASPIEIDGLVIEQDRKTKRPTSGNPDYMIAWKVQEESATAIAEVVKVIWQTSKYGKLKPVLLLKVPGKESLKRLKL